MLDNMKCGNKYVNNEENRGDAGGLEESRKYTCCWAELP